MSILPGIDIVTCANSHHQKDDFLAWKKQSIRKEREFLINLKKTYNVKSSLKANMILKESTSPMSNFIGQRKPGDGFVDHAKAVEDILNTRGPKRNFVRFSQAHQGVLQYLTQKHKMEKKALEQRKAEQNERVYKTLSIRPQTR
jgi:hypothetical protein